ncbi:DNA-directed RNA polymerase subunit omega [Sulfurospirillum sp. T05]|uniref:DNA-directed RNA polymerase subunit omega n=1 Tax=Sulfurospirillum tamanense TaxID=2813362 RepID=A0ABS2WUA4_9BACT|nr:DNA-directed RNA polymerase subunit omega [Sulfurospirillum tamanensis]MBN2965246.1 DNA-directed RNA polymerase subunit omega [Sulfurospirillum tamanensis]
MRIEKITAKAMEHMDGDRYKLALVVAKRAEELAAGSMPLISVDKNKVKFADIALMEVAEGKLSIETLLRCEE